TARRCCTTLISIRSNHKAMPSRSRWPIEFRNKASGSLKFPLVFWIDVSDNLRCHARFSWRVSSGCCGHASVSSIQAVYLPRHRTTRPLLQAARKYRRSNSLPLQRNSVKDCRSIPGVVGPFSYDGMNALAAVDQRGHTWDRGHMHDAWPGDDGLYAQHHE